MDKKEAKQLIDTVRTIFNEWDFLGVIGGKEDGGPFDEYDDLVGPVTTLINQRADREKLEKYIDGELKDAYGLSSYSKDGLEKTLDKLTALSKSI
jgi:hypothetical protein